MYLAEFELENFRKISSETFQFHQGLNVILGENNSGKSAVIDALRLILGMGPGRRDIWADADDRTHDGKGEDRLKSFTITATFRDLSVREQGLFSMCLCPSESINTARVHMRYEAADDPTRQRGHVHVWGGETEGEHIPSDVLGGIRTVYLEPLRDAAMGLRPGRGSRLARLLAHLAPPDSNMRTELEDVVAKANEDLAKAEVVREAGKSIVERLKGTTGPVLAQTAELRFTEAEFGRISQNLRALVGDSVALDLEENGLGYNNLLYIATVLSELQEDHGDETDLAILLIEEPEAHLHPQLQTLLIDYLQGLTEEGDSVNDTDEATNASNGEAAAQEGDPQGSVSTPVQVFVTTHSPVLASRADLDSLHLLYRRQDGKPGYQRMAGCKLGNNEKAFITRFLDVTKAQLFFGRGVILVEGISEAMLVPAIAEQCLGRPLQHHGVTVVNVQSLGFAPFARLFQEDQIDVRAVIVTDADPKPDCFPSQPDPAHWSDSARKAAKAASGALKTMIGTKTLEYDLALAGNGPLMAEVYAELHKNSGPALQEAIDATDDVVQHGKLIVKKLNTSRDKARFAQQLCRHILEGVDFFVPQYLADAIDYVTEGSDEPGSAAEES